MDGELPGALIALRPEPISNPLFNTAENDTTDADVEERMELIRQQTFKHEQSTAKFNLLDRKLRGQLTVLLNMALEPHAIGLLGPLRENNPMMRKVVDAATGVITMTAVPDE